jgi:thiamine monophosphate synthase
VAIGSITPERVADVVAAGASGVAVASAIVATPDAAQATRAFREALDRCAALSRGAPAALARDEREAR